MCCEGKGAYGPKAGYKQGGRDDVLTSKERQSFHIFFWSTDGFCHPLSWPTSLPLIITHQFVQSACSSFLAKPSVQLLSTFWPRCSGRGSSYCMQTFHMVGTKVLLVVGQSAAWHKQNMKMDNASLLPPTDRIKKSPSSGIL